MCDLQGVFILHYIYFYLLKMYPFKKCAFAMELLVVLHALASLYFLDFVQLLCLQQFLQMCLSL
jgi:hypothetical protein